MQCSLESVSVRMAELMVQSMPRIEAAGPGPVSERLNRLNVRVQSEDISYARMLTKATSSLIGPNLRWTSIAK